MVLALLCVAQFVVVLDTTIVAVALPATGADLGGDAAQLQWVVTSYTVAFSGLLVFGGRIADVAGRRRCFIAGLMIFAAASLVCGLSPNLGTLIVARAFQGAGAALLAPAALALLTGLYGDGHARRRALAWWTAAAAGGGATGWVLGGMVATGIGWRWIFLVNLPIAVAGCALALRLLRAGGGATRRLDVPGAITVTLALTLLVLALTRFEHGAVLAGVLGLAGAFVAAAAFVWVERRSADPLVPARLVADKSFGTANLVTAVLTAVTTPPLLLCVLHLQGPRDRSALETGLAFVPFNLAVVAGSLAAPAVFGRWGSRATTVLGLVGIAAGSSLLALLPSTGAYLGILLPAFLLMGCGLGLASTSITTVGVSVADGPDHGVASGVLTATAQAGTAIGIAGIVGLASGLTAAADSIEGIRLAALAAAGLALLATYPALVTRR
ncbi:MFS transporter [Kribbella deserti]|uniref:MFS transporter n=1 Tax=Kribbella deserti TaxID=1926257 RepID=A0ABV6QR92_9ACTN